MATVFSSKPHLKVPKSVKRAEETRKTSRKRRAKFGPRGEGRKNRLRDPGIAMCELEPITIR